MPWTPKRGQKWPKSMTRIPNKGPKPSNCVGIVDGQLTDPHFSLHTQVETWEYSESDCGYCSPTIAEVTTFDPLKNLGRLLLAIQTFRAIFTCCNSYLFNHSIAPGLYWHKQLKGLLSKNLQKPYICGRGGYNSWGYGTYHVVRK